MIAIDPPVRILNQALASKGPFSNRVLPVNSLLLAWKPSEWNSRQARAEASWIADFDEPTRAIRQFFNCLSLCKMGVDGGPTNPLDA
jgi:hypothetical protein